jgi:glycosyltransferase involved in cell wall biosynthesis
MADGVAVALAARGRRPRYLRPLDLRDIIASTRPDVVHSHNIQALSVVGPLAGLGLVPHWIHTFHYGNYPYPKRRYMLMERVYSRWADQLVAVAEPQRDALKRHLSISDHRIVTVSNGVAPNAFRGTAQMRARKRAELGISADAFLVGTVAVLTEQKGIDYLIEAARLARQTLPGVKFLVVGGGRLQDVYQQRVANEGLGSTMILPGWRSDVPELLASLDAYVMPSLWEAMPLALLEAMAAACPIVVTEVGDNRRIVGDGTAAMLIPPRDAPAIAAAIAHLAARPDVRDALGRRALATFEERYTVARMVARYGDLYRLAARTSPDAAVPTSVRAGVQG